MIDTQFTHRIHAELVGKTIISSISVLHVRGVKISTSTLCVKSLTSFFLIFWAVSTVSWELIKCYLCLIQRYIIQILYPLKPKFRYIQDCKAECVWRYSWDRLNALTQSPCHRQHSWWLQWGPSVTEQMVILWPTKPCAGSRDLDQAQTWIRDLLFYLHATNRQTNKHKRLLYDRYILVAYVF